MPDGATDKKGISAQRLKSFIERIEILEEEKKGTGRGYWRGLGRSQVDGLRSQNHAPGGETAEDGRQRPSGAGESAAGLFGRGRLLGRGLISSGPKSGRCECDGRKEVARQFVKARGDPPEVLELAEEALHEIALAVDAPIYRTLNHALAGRGYVGFGPVGSDQIEQGVGVIAAIGDDMPAFETGEQKRRGT